MKILIISQNSYPFQGPRAFRTQELSEQLTRMGNEVILYTVHGSYNYEEYEKSTGVTMRNIKTLFPIETNDNPHKTLLTRAIYHFLHRPLLWPHCEFHFRVEKIICENPGVDLLITIAYPHSIHSGAARAKRKHPDIFPKHWICDCGDPFMLNPLVCFPKYMEKYERMWCEGCDYITVPTEQSYKGYYKEYWDKIRVIPQGFDFSKTPVAEYKKNPIPTFVFVGTVYPGVRDPHSFMDYLLKYDKPYRFIMMMLRPLENKYIKESKGQIEYVIGKGRKDVIMECSKADFLINIPNPNSVQTPSKLIDYGISGRPILNVQNDFNDDSTFREFIEGNYTQQYQVKDLERYNIVNVANEFIKAAQSKCPIR